MKGWRKMHPQTQSASHPLPLSSRTRPTEDVVYQAVTVAAILLVLGSLWIF